MVTQHDYDLSFERLADAVDAGTRVFSGRRWEGPDYRMRCNLSPVYAWPEGAPYDGGKVTTVHVAGHASHYMADPTNDWPRVLCGFGRAPEERKPTTGEPSCPECRREPGLVEHLRSSPAPGPHEPGHDAGSWRGRPWPALGSAVPPGSGPRC